VDRKKNVIERHVMITAIFGALLVVITQAPKPNVTVTTVSCMLFTNFGCLW